jgi:membrane protease YdiL (CAAX protease family)
VDQLSAFPRCELCDSVTDGRVCLRCGAHVRGVRGTLTRPQPRTQLLVGVSAGLLLGSALTGAFFLARPMPVPLQPIVIPAPPPGHWWTWPVLLMDATGAALLEEVIVLGYLVTRLQQVGWTPIAAVIGSAILRGGYHLYQGWGGFVGNLLMGLLFGLLFLRWRRTWPFVVAHALLDIAAGAGYLLFRQHLPGF